MTVPAREVPLSRQDHDDLVQAVAANGAAIAAVGAAVAAVGAAVAANGAAIAAVARAIEAVDTKLSGRLEHIEQKIDRLLER